MARTKDPHAAAIKAWETRGRAVRGSGSEPIASGGDFGAIGLADLGKVLESQWTGRDREEIDGAVQILRHEIRSLQIPDTATDGLSHIFVTSEVKIREFSHDPAEPAMGVYLPGVVPMVVLNAKDIVRRRADVSADTIAHEVGHHAHLSKLTDRTAAEWAVLSRHGANCRLSNGGRLNTTEHFADAFAAYAQHRVPYGRVRLKDLEPKTAEFMERLWRTPSMWRPNRTTLYNDERANG